MIHYRMYSKDDRSSYIKFCKKIFGKKFVSVKFRFYRLVVEIQQ